jgi:hypothetical protein
MSGENPQQMSSGQASPRWVIGGHDRSDAWSPVKTAEGRAEITRRSRALNQRLRTVLLLIDGRRTISQIRTVAEQVGAPNTCLDDLLNMGLVALPEPAAATSAPAAETAVAPAVVAAPELPVAAPAAAPIEATPPPVVEAAAEPESVAVIEPIAFAPASLAEPPPDPSASEPLPAVAASEPAEAPLDLLWAQPDTMPLEPYHDDYIRVSANDDTQPGELDVEPGAAPESTAKRLTSELFDELVRATPRRDAGPSTIDSTLRTGASTGGRLDSMMSSLFPLIESAFGSAGRIPNADRPQDDALEEARRILMREVRSKAPVTGALTLVKLRRATTREELTALFDEVGSHISLPMRRLSTQQILLHVKSLLERPM